MENSSIQSSTNDKCREWLDTCSESALSTEDDSSVFTESTCSSSNFESFYENNAKTMQENSNISIDMAGIDTNLDSLNKNINIESIQVYKSKNVQIGNVNNFNGPTIINQYAPSSTQTVLSDRFIEPPPFTIVPRRAWLAQPPRFKSEVLNFAALPKYVIISHSATEESSIQTENNLNVRLIQQFHVESRGWNDIAYNFLIGADGSVYEGRGWDTIGSHSRGYNARSLGICFIGYYMDTLPPDMAIQKAKNLIKYAVELGKLANDYKLLGHCQCSSTASPGKRLFEDIKTWENWDSSVSVQNPLPFVNNIL